MEGKNNDKEFKIPMIITTIVKIGLALAAAIFTGLFALDRFNSRDMDSGLAAAVASVVFCALAYILYKKRIK